MSARRTIIGAEPEALDPKIKSTLTLIHNGRGKPCPISEDDLQPLRTRNYIYSVRFGDNLFVHLTKRGCEALGLDPGDRK